MKKIIFLLVIFVTVALKPTADIFDARTLVTAMHKKYFGNFNANITFIQLNTDYLPNGKTKGSLSYEAFHYPGKFRVDFGAVHSQEGLFVINDTTYEFKEGQIVKKTYKMYDLLMLTGDIYFLQPNISLEKLDAMGYDLAKFHENVWKDEPVFVVGASEGDTLSPQFWIDKKELYLLRVISKNPETGEVEDAHFKEHTKVKSAWVEERVEIYVQGKLKRREHYVEVSANNSLDMKIFQPDHLGKVHWRKKI
jgi:hypothetical protein